MILRGESPRAGSLVLGFAFNQWQDYQDDDEEDFFDTYESRRVDRVSSNRNRV